MDEVTEWILKYNSRFSDGFPSYPLMGNGEDAVIKIVKDCLGKGKDVYQLGYLPDPTKERVVY